MKEVVFIAGTSHNGSTLLDLVLGGHPRFVGLGEIFPLLKTGSDQLERTSETLCSCGKHMDQCPYWGQLSVKLLTNRDASTRDKYRILLDAFDEAFGKDCVMVDSSKSLKALQMLVSVPEVEVKVLHLIKDVRAWTVSIRDRFKRRGEFHIKDLLRKYGWKAGIPYMRRMSLYCFRRWYLENRKLQDFLKRRNTQVFQLGYEELCLYPKSMFHDICKFLGVEMIDSMFSLQESGSHSVGGNRMASQMEKRQGIFYDNRWFYRNDWLLPMAIFPHIMRYNKKEVYRNELGILWTK